VDADGGKTNQTTNIRNKMKAEPLKKTIYDKAKELGITNIILKFSGGSDEGYLDIEFDDYDKHDQDFVNEIEEWAWETYSYSGAGDGSDYGDNINYDIDKNKVSTSEWYHIVEENDGGEEELELAKDEKE
jgi:hypothetical protein